MKRTEDATHKWHVVDADGKVLGRLASNIAILLSGKRAVDYAPHVDSGDGVIVLNCGKLRVTGKKTTQKLYKSYTGYPGGLREKSYEKMLVQKPKYILWHAVKGMLPKNKIAAKMLGRLKLYEGTAHKQAAQRPDKIEIA
jgi:large subunit ribosomal protein L13